MLQERGLRGPIWFSVPDSARLRRQLPGPRGSAAQSFVRGTVRKRLEFSFTRFDLIEFESEITFRQRVSRVRLATRLCDAATY